MVRPRAVGLWGESEARAAGGNVNGFRGAMGQEVLKAFGKVHTLGFSAATTDLLRFSR